MLERSIDEYFKAIEAIEEKAPYRIITKEVKSKQEPTVPKEEVMMHISRLPRNKMFSLSAKANDFGVTYDRFKKFVNEYCDKKNLKLVIHQRGCTIEKK